MSLRQGLRWGGWWIILAAILMNGMNILVYAGFHNAAIQAAYGMGFTGMILACTIIHIAQAQRAGILGLIAYLVSLLSLAYSNVVTFLILAELWGIEGVHEAFLGIWHPVMRMAVYSIFLGLILLGISIARAGVLPRWSGILLALGVALQLPAQYAMELAGPLFFLFTIGGSLLCGAGLIWIGWALYSGRALAEDEPGLSNLDRAWGGPFVVLAAVLLTANAYVNTFGSLNLAAGLTHLLSQTGLMLSIVILGAAQARRAGGPGLAGMAITHLGAALLLIPAYLIVGQLAGQIADNRALMASWDTIPVGRAGLYMVFLGNLLFGISAIQAGVFPRGSGWLVVLGLALLVPSQLQSQAYLFSIFWVIGATLQGIGLAWMGITLRDRRKTQPIVQLHESTP
jgi:hypothetical protein